MPSKLREDVATGIKSGPHTWVTKTAAFTMDVDDRAIKVSGTFALTVPLLTDDVAEDYLVKQIGAGAITLTPQGSDTIDRNSNFVMLAEDEAMRLTPDVVNRDWVLGL